MDHNDSLIQNQCLKNTHGKALGSCAVWIVLFVYLKLDLIQSKQILLQVLHNRKYCNTPSMKTFFLMESRYRLKHLNGYSAEVITSPLPLTPFNVLSVIDVLERRHSRQQWYDKCFSPLIFPFQNRVEEWQGLHFNVAILSISAGAYMHVLTSFAFLKKAQMDIAFETPSSLLLLMLPLESWNAMKTLIVSASFLNYRLTALADPKKQVSFSTA